MIMRGMVLPGNINLCILEAWPYPGTFIVVYERHGRTREHLLLLMRGMAVPGIIYSGHAVAPIIVQFNLYLHPVVLFIVSFL